MHAWPPRMAAAIPGVTQSLQDNAQKNTKEYLDLLVSAQRFDLAQHTLAWSAWNKLTVCGSAKVKTAGRAGDGSGRDAGQPRRAAR
jgi:hypothetical protein